MSWAIYDIQGYRGLGLALIERKQGPASSLAEWVSDVRTAIRSRVGGEVTVTIDCIPRAYNGPSFFPGGATSPRGT